MSEPLLLALGDFLDDARLKIAGVGGGQAFELDDQRFALAEPNNAVVHVRLGGIAERNQDFPRAFNNPDHPCNKLDSDED